ncbi:acyl carrier protein [Streptomyces sp. NPDC021020]|uniref:acyl carrier protein n=1 Tax=Streptomyces sp. NPDC021020 TaxID=3365109 RepID=UPI00379D560B
MRLEELVAAVLELPPDVVTDDTAQHNTGEWTSRSHIQLVVAVEDAYGVSLSLGEIRELTSVGAARRILEGRGVPVG